MRKLGLFLVSVCAAGMAHAAAPDAKVNVNCALFSECATPEAEATTPSATPAANPRVRTGTTRGFSMAGPMTPTAPAATSGKASTKATAVQAARRPKAVVAAPRKSVQAMQAAEAIRTAQLITFRSGSADLTSEGTAMAQQIATAMLRADKSSLRFSLEGHTDAVGNKASNLPLSQRRASALAAYLVNQGVAPARLETVGYGFDRPLPGLPGTSSANRRVEVKPVR